MSSSEQIVYHDPRDLHPMPNQPRASMDEGKVKGLADTFREKGFRGAVIIWYPREGYAEIISGHRSHRAFMIVAEECNFEPPWDKVPCAPFYDISKAKAFELAVLYNEKREDLTLIELATSFDRLVHEFNMDPKEVAKDFEVSTSTVYNTISILKEPAFIINAVEEKKLTLADILGLRRVKDPARRIKLAKQLISGEVAKADLPNIAKKWNRETKVLSLIPELETDLRDDEEKVTKGTRMKIAIPEDFTLYFTFGAATRIDWMRLPQRNILVSGYHVLHRSGKQAMVADMVTKRDKMHSLMIDSAAIVAMNRGDIDWFNQQEALVDFANAVEADVVSHLDVLCKTHLLEKCNLSLDEAQKITIKNAEEMMDLKTKARKCYVLQGHESEEYGQCIDAYQDLGIFDDDSNIIGVGSQAGERRETTVRRYGYVAERVLNINSHLEIHAFGIGSPWTLVQLHKLGVRRADNMTPAVLTQINQWIDSRTGESAKNVRLCDERIGAMYDAQMLWNYAAYFVGVSNEFKKNGFG